MFAGGKYPRVGVGKQTVEFGGVTFEEVFGEMFDLIFIIGVCGGTG